MFVWSGHGQLLTRHTNTIGPHACPSAYTVGHYFTPYINLHSFIQWYGLMESWMIYLSFDSSGASNLCAPFQFLRDVSVNLVLMLTRKIIHILFAM